MRVVNAQMTSDVRLLIIPCRAILALESRRLLALITQMRHHRFFPLVQIVTTGTLEHAVSFTDADSALARMNHLESPLPSRKSIWNPWKKRERFNNESSFRLSLAKDASCETVSACQQTSFVEIMKITVNIVITKLNVHINVINNMSHEHRRNKKKKRERRVKSIDRTIVIFISAQINKHFIMFLRCVYILSYKISSM